MKIGNQYLRGVMSHYVDPISKINNICLVTITLILSTTALMYTKVIMVPLVFAIFLYATTSSTIRYFSKRWKLSKKMAIFATFSVIVFTTSITSIFMITSIKDFVQSSHEYQSKVLAFIDWVTKSALQFGYEFNAETIKQKLTELPLFDIAQGVTGNIFSFIGNLFLVLILALFLGVSNRKSEGSPKIVEEIKVNISRYIFVKVMTSAINGILVWLILMICNVQLSFLLGVLAFLLNFVPSVGGLITTLLPIPIILLQYGFGWQFTLGLSLIAVSQFITGSFVEPRMIGDSVDLHPITILISLLFWGLIWGVPGMFLSVPITAVLRIIFYRIETTKPLAELLAGRF